MTEHSELKMHHEERRVTEPDEIDAILGMCETATLALHDEPFPYVVPMNYGFDRENGQLVMYLHMFTSGHKVDLLRADPRVSVNVHAYLSRFGSAKYRNEAQDYRSVTVFGTAEIVTADDEARYLHGFCMLQRKNRRPDVTVITPSMRKNALLLRVPAEIVTAKAQYPIHGLDEIPMPGNIPAHKY